MSSLDPFNVTDWDAQPKLRFAWRFNLKEVYDLWHAVAQLNYYLVKDEEEEPLPYDHPLMKIVFEIQGKLDELIAEAMREGWNIAPLLEIKQILNAPDDDGEVHK